MRSARPKAPASSTSPPAAAPRTSSLGRQYALPLVAPLEDEGHFVDGFAWLTGMHVSEVAAPIFAELERKGLLYVVEPYTHRYPTCWRCRTELVFRLVDEWFISMGEVYDKPREQLTAEEKSRSLRYQIMDVVEQIRWIPEFGYSREMDWLHNMHDWMISKKRYWGLALPIWVCSSCGSYEVIGDEVELKSRAVAGWEEFEGHTPHRPYIDAVRLECPHCHGRMSRIPDVGNPWLDAGIVPFSTLQYRHDREYWRSWYPAQWISESFPGQFRNWFYSLLAMATVVDSSPPFLENFGYATLLAEDGRPMHKSWGNSIEFNEAADKMGVDVMRWLYCAHKPENELLIRLRARRRGPPPVPDPPVECVQLPGNLRPPGWLGANPCLRPVYTGRPHPAQRQPARPLDPGAPEPGGRAGYGVPGRIGHAQRHHRAGIHAGRSEQLVRAPQPAALLEIGARRR